MSIESMSIALHHSAAKGTSKLILLGIANHDGDGGAWPTIDTLGKYGSCGRTRVKEALRLLEELGEIRVVVNGGGNETTRGDRRPNRYEITLSCPPECDRTKHHRTGVTMGDSRDERGSLSDERGSLLEPTGVTMGDYKPSINQPIEPPLLPAAVAAGVVVAEIETENQRVQRITRTYTDVVALSNFPAVMGIVKKAVKAGYGEQPIIDALARLAAEGRSVTTDTLRIEIDGLTPRGKPSVMSIFAGADAVLANNPFDRLGIEA